MEKILRYPNGLRAVVESGGKHSVSMGIWTNAGSQKETTENNGISHFIEHMIFKGTNELNPFEIAKSFEDMGAAINAFTSKDCTCYFVKCLTEYIEPCFKLLSHIFLDSVFLQEELDRERNVIVEEINMQEDAPEDVCFNILASSLFDGPLSQSILGSAENILRFNKPDIVRYMDSQYCPPNIVVAFAGNIESAHADSLINKYFLPKIRIKGDCTAAGENRYACKQTVKIDDYEQSNLYLGFPSIELNHPDSPTQSLLSVILGGGMSSRLFQSVRERLGLAYSVYTVPSSYVNAGSFNICVNYTASNTGKVLDCLRKEIELFGKDGANKDEFLRAKAQLKASLVFSQENVQSRMLSAGKLLLLCDEFYDISKKLKEIDAVTIEDINAFSRRLFVNKPALAYLGKHPDVNPEW